MPRMNPALSGSFAGKKTGSNWYGGGPQARDIAIACGLGAIAMSGLAPGASTSRSIACAAEVRKAAQYTLTCENVFRTTSVTSGMRTNLGIRVNDDTDTPITAWNNNAWYLSQRGSLMSTVASGSTSAQITTDYNGLYTINKVTGSGNSSLLFDGTTYYYTSQLILDSALSVGRNQSHAEVSAAPSAANTRIGMALGWGTGTQAGIVRIYRGTSTGSYDKVVNLPLMRGLYIGDDGGNCNGVAWGSRTAGPVDAITSTSASKWIITPIGKVSVA